VVEEIEYNKNLKRMKLDEISEQFQVGINSLRYHIKKLKPLFLDVSRDRYNRFLFTSAQVDRLLHIHRLKNQGYPYEKIREQISTAPEQNNYDLEPRVPVEIINSSSKLERDWEHKLLQMERHQKKLHEINKILIKTNKEFDTLITEQKVKIDSLEERVALLIDLHTENLLKRGLNFTGEFNEILDEEGD